MPPPGRAKTVRDLIYWEYSKLIAGSAVGNRKNYRFVSYTFKQLKTGKKKFSPIKREEEKQRLIKEDICAYCGAPADQWEHIIPRSRGGPDTFHNEVRACKKCNLAKRDRDPFEWYGEAHIDELPRIVLGKYLKMIYDFHEKYGTLDSADIDMDGQLNIYDLGAIFKKR